MKKSQALLDNFSSISNVDKPTINNLSFIFVKSSHMPAEHKSKVKYSSMWE